LISGKLQGKVWLDEVLVASEEVDPGKLVKNVFIAWAISVSEFRVTPSTFRLSIPS
jgi:hypothetical protein